ncbi:MAG: MurT ligase domain-containing protein [Deltaproteobacteria bacterium]|jgi:UDP-N-acetylmuramyl tripeptide synthase|nr:MurT ligase domain-containing protein [Deltaproteobacteria bacterium]MCL5880916.1 MurT ligase domain-containing protein [Deltaproteobacteria bacterium]MDA8303702.1 MurT ligase domain-containing protein [Deltaproteobacteria bacterium]
MTLRFKNKIEILFYKFFKNILNIFFKREGDVLPAYILKKLDKDIFDDFSKGINSYNVPIIIVTGTNGKTTTSNLISDTLKNSGKNVCTNSNGANMPNGIFGSIIGSYDLMLKFNADFIVMEVDEKVFPDIVSKLSPNVIVITNFYRDQLDRYGEVNITVNKIKNAIRNLPYSPKLILPSYEPLGSFIGYGLNNPQIYYGFNENFFENEINKINGFSSNLSDALTCPNCGHILFCEKNLNKNIFLLRFNCKYCGFEGKEPEIYACKFNDKGIKGLYDKTADKIFYFKPKLSGDYNMANYAAAYAVLKNYELDGETIRASFENFRSKFGRSYKSFLKGIEINIDLVKNPTGFNRVLEKIAGEDGFINVLFAFSDRDADGRDVSWIWDVDFEAYAGKLGKIVITGTRPFDMAIRLQTAGVNKDSIVVDHNLKSSLKRIMKICSEGGGNTGGGNKRIFILPTYTELLKFKKYII